ncbi:MAG: HupE/UreJ family protein [Pseudomonadota bacterium]
MSKARIVLLEGGRLEVRLSLDLLVEVGSRERYYALSQSPDPLADPDIQELLAPLPEAIELTVGNLRIPLKLQSIDFPSVSREEFLDPLSWPRTDLLLFAKPTSVIGNGADGRLKVRYGTGFRFEEPIANTFEDTISGRSQTRWLVAEQRSPAFDASGWHGTAPNDLETSVDWGGLASFFIAGFAHILPAGFDHLLFVAALCLGAAGLRSIVEIVTAFTIAHSLSLAAMTLGWINISGAWIEPFVVLSIFWAATINLRSAAPAALTLPTALGFGLIHGLGFAGALREIGLPAEQQILSLLSFNLGVEAGQVLFVALLLIAAQIIPRKTTEQNKANGLPLGSRERRWGSALIMACTIPFAMTLL